MKKAKKRKSSQKNTPHRKKVTFVLMMLGILFFISCCLPLRKSFALTLAGGVKIIATVVPSYSLTTQNNILYVKTNMTVFVNGKRVVY